MGIWLVTLSVLYRRSAVVKALLRFTYDAKYHPTRCKQITGIWLVTLWGLYRRIGPCLPPHLFFSYFYCWSPHRLTPHRFLLIATPFLVSSIIIAAQCSLGRSNLHNFVLSFLAYGHKCKLRIGNTLSSFSFIINKGILLFH